MAIITPTITTDDAHVFRDQIGLISDYADGVHLDFSDGIFSPAALLPLESAWRSDDLITHVHVMYQKPMEVLDDIINLEADLVILHAESDDVKFCLESLLENGTRVGVALLPETSLVDMQELEVDGLIDHVLVFGGHLGYQGGEADLDLLDKVKRIRKAYPDMEISWDGGVNDKTAQQIAKAGVDILNVGGYLHDSEDPKKAYDKLLSLVS